MQQIPEALAPMALYAQFLIYRLVPSATPGKMDKIPHSPHTAQPYPKGSDWQRHPAQWASAEQAMIVATSLGPEYGAGFIFTDNDPFWFLDVDACVVDGQWSDAAQNILACLPGAAFEMSTSGTGFHLFGQGTVPAHGCRNKLHNCEFYHTGRFVALTGKGATGSAALDFTQHLPPIINYYFPPSAAVVIEEWTDGPVEHYTGTETNEELIAKAVASTGVHGVFDRGMTFKDVWEGNEAKLSAAWPSDKDDPWDGSMLDASLAQRLAWWTGGDCERIKEIMLGSIHVRDKWDRDGYLDATIQKACAKQTTYYSIKEPVEEIEGAAALKGSKGQIEYAEGLRAQKLAAATPEQREALLGVGSAQVWIDAKDKTAEELVTALAPMSEVAPLVHEGPILTEGQRYLDVAGQVEFFKGCVYVMSEKGVYVPGLGIMGQDQFNVMLAGYEFEMAVGKKDTSKPWDAFTQTTLIAWPKVICACFRPLVKPGAQVIEAGVAMVNTYEPVDVPSEEGDIEPFLAHMRKLLPVRQDRILLISWMSACVQHVGHKFQWAPFIQGIQGNGKSFLSECVAEAVGRRYCNFPQAKEIAEKFNGWSFGKLFIGVEDIYISDSKKEVMEVIKPMITAKRQPRRGMGTEQRMDDNYANWMLNSNHMDGYRASEGDRRVAPFLTAQQEVGDLRRDGMDGDYLIKLYRWAEQSGGFARVTHYLKTYKILSENNPALGAEAGGTSGRKPTTSSSHVAYAASLGSIEQEIQECVDQGVEGFRGDWISSLAVDKLLIHLRKDHLVPRNKRRELMVNLGYDKHPALPEGKATRKMDIDDGGRPIPYVKKGSISAGIDTPKAATNAYEKAQQSTAEVSRIFETKEVAKP